MASKSEEERVSIRLDVIKDIIEDIERNHELQKIFGSPVSESLVIIADNNDIRIEEGGAITLTKAECKRFADVLNGIIENSTL